ncbi:MAG: hypothetical protein JST69_06795 [Bacteroidetes bacterium]|nr:hypothetical protein [Bacteroidota bacterium]
MATFLFENDSVKEVCIEVIKCPVDENCYQKYTGDDRYDTFIVPPQGNHRVETDCDAICWKRCAYPNYQRTNNIVISV